VNWRRHGWWWWWLALACVNAAATPSPTLQSIEKAGVIRIGVKADFPPFGMLDAKGQPVGMEVDLARDVARRLNVSESLVKVTTANRLQRLEQGAVDLVIATAADTIERRRITTAIEPPYYAGGVTVMMREKQRIQDWGGLRGKTVCATQGAYYNRPMSERFLLDLVIYRNTRDALLGLRDGRCVGYLYTDSAIRSFLAEEEWKDYAAPLPLALVTQWALFLARSEKGSELDQALGDIVADWHRSGFLKEREAAWGLPPSSFLIQMQTKWLERDKGGQLICSRTPEGEWPTACRNVALLTSAEATGLQNIGLLIKESTGIDLSFVYDPFDRTRFLKGLAITVAMMVGCVLASLASGMGWALLADDRVRWVSALARLVAVYARMTPPLLQMYLLFFGVGGVLFASLGWSLYPMAVAIGSMSFYTGAAIMNSLVEAARHRRLSDPTFRLQAATLVQALALAKGPVMGSLINVMKQTVIASAIGVPELLLMSLAIMADQGNVTVMMNVLLVTYLGLITAAAGVLAWLQRRITRRYQEAG
jgi:polar amino acid transport system substrate-binding protein